MKDENEIQESFLEPGTRFTTRNQSTHDIYLTRKAFRNITGMMWICNRAEISYGYLEQGHTLIMIWIN